MKKVIVAFVVCLLFFWTARIISINRNSPITTCYNIGDTLDCGDLEVSFIESHLDDPNEFKKRFGVDSDGSCGEHKVLSICIDVTNRSTIDADMDEVRGFLECGFDSTSWASAIDPEVTKQINATNKNSIAPGSSQKIWFITEVNKVCFKDSSWKHIDELPFMYVLTLSPQKIAVRLDV
jgi:hypothetical protein